MTHVHFYLIGSLLGVTYEVLTTKRSHYKDLGIVICSSVFLFLIITSWFGLIVSIATDINGIKSKLKEESI